MPNIASESVKIAFWNVSCHTHESDDLRPSSSSASSSPTQDSLAQLVLLLPLQRHITCTAFHTLSKTLSEKEYFTGMLAEVAQTVCEAFFRS